MSDEHTVLQQADGTFEVTLTPQEHDPGRGGAGPGRMLIDKQFLGDIAGTSQGEMLAIRSETPGSAGYVAMECVRGTLKGREGSFALQHSGSMARGHASLVISVVPDSGTGALTGLTGAMTIDFSSAPKHGYSLKYSLPDGD